MKINGPLGISKLVVEDFMRVQVFEVELQEHGGVVVLTGKNGQGKTSVLDAIWVGLGGTAGMPEVPVRQGASSARIEVTLSDDDGVKLVVERKITRKEDGSTGTTLTVKNADNMRADAPQKTLDALLGQLSFDPLTFVRMSAKDQAETLRKLVGLDFTAIEAKRKRAFDERTEIGREVKGGQHALSMMQPPPSDTPDDEVDPAEIAKELDAAKVAEAQERARIAAITEAQEAFARADIAKRAADQRVDELERLLAAAEAESAAAIKAIEQAADAVNERRAAAPIHVPDTAAIMAKISDVQRINRNVAQKRSIAAKRAEVERAEARHAAKTSEIEAIDAEKAKMITEAKMPLDGLGFGDGMVMYGTLPFAQASDAMRTEISCAIAAALNPKLRVMRIRDGSLLDSDALARLTAWAKENQQQVWMEAVESDAAGAIVLEDGHIQGVEPRPREEKPARGKTPASVDPQAAML